MEVVRWRTGLTRGGLMVGLVLIGVGVFLYDHDSVKKLPVVGGLPWGRVIGNTAVQEQARPVAEHVQAVDAANRQQPRVIVLGDSLAAKWATVGATAWNRQMGALNAVTLGVASDRTQHLLHRIRVGDFSRLAPRVGVLIIGTNNVNRNTPEETHDGVLRVVDELHIIWPHTALIVVGVVPRQLPEGLARQRRIDALNALLSKSMLTRDWVTFVPMRQEFLLGEERLNPALYEEDGIHLTAAGYEVLTARLAPLISAISPPSTEPVRLEGPAESTQH